jgi:hypothetical protein
LLNEDGGYQHQQDQYPDKGDLEEYPEGVPEAGFDFHGVYILWLWGVS